MRFESINRRREPKSDSLFELPNRGGKVSSRRGSGRDPDARLIKRRGSSEKKARGSIVSESRSFKDLEEVLRGFGAIPGSQEIFRANDLIAMIGEVRDGNLNIDSVTRTYGIRDKVRQLMEPSGDRFESPNQDREQSEYMQGHQERYENEKERTIAEFFEFVRGNHNRLAEQYRNNHDRLSDQRVPLRKIFYNEFYTGESVEQEQHDPEEVRRIERQYNRSIKSMYEHLSQRRGIKLDAHPKKYWFHAFIGRDLRDADIGRFYINIMPERAPEFFGKVAEAFKDNDIKAQMKIPLWGDINSLSRSDKMVVYFEEEDEKDALRIIENLYHTEPDSFESDIPKFSLNVKNEAGELMRGVGFAENPENVRYSFGTVRCAVLEDVYHDAASQGVEVYDSDFDFEASFRRACGRYGVDPENPAFNDSAGSFPAMKIRHGLLSESSAGREGRGQQGREYESSGRERVMKARREEIQRERRERERNAEGAQKKAETGMREGEMEAGTQVDTQKEKISNGEHVAIPDDNRSLEDGLKQAREKWAVSRRENQGLGGEVMWESAINEVKSFDDLYETVRRLDNNEEYDLKELKRHSSWTQGVVLINAMLGSEVNYLPAVVAEFPKEHGIRGAALRIARENQEHQMEKMKEEGPKFFNLDDAIIFLAADRGVIYTGNEGRYNVNDLRDLVHGVDKGHISLGRLPLAYGIHNVAEQILRARESER